jgi:hypothetical protein
MTGSLLAPVGGPARRHPGSNAGKRVAVIERRSAIGGACINTGAIPRKAVPLHRFARDSRTRFAPGSSPPRIELPLEAPDHIEAPDSRVCAPASI